MCKLYTSRVTRVIWNGSQSIDGSVLSALFNKVSSTFLCVPGWAVEGSLFCGSSFIGLVFSGIISLRVC